MKIRFLFYKAKMPDGEWIDDGISIWTWILAAVSFDFKRLKYNYSHVEIWLNGDGRTFRSVKGRVIGKCFSSTTRGGAEGVRFAPARKVLKHPERWDYVEFEVDAERLEVAMVEARKLVGKKYDYAGLFGFFSPFNIHDKNKWYCSEVCAWFAYLVRILPKRHRRISPRRLARKLVDAGGVLKPLA